MVAGLKTIAFCLPNFLSYYISLTVCLLTERLFCCKRNLLIFVTAEPGFVTSYTVYTVTPRSQREASIFV